MDIFNETNVEPKFEDLVGEGKKYRDAEAAAKALVEKDAFIARVLEEKRALEAHLNEKAFEDRIKALEAAKTTEQVVTTPPPVSQPQTTPQDLEATVQKIVNEREAAQNRTRNLMNVQEKLNQVYGADYPNRVKARAQELGISMSRLNEMAAETPTAFYAILGLDNQRPTETVAPPATRQNSAAAFTPTTTRKNNEYYANLRRTNPTLYFSPKVQMEEWNEAKRQGEAFYS